MNIRLSLLALGALTLPTAALAQYGAPNPASVATPLAASAARRGVPSRGWRSRLRSGQPWQSPIAESNKAPALEPIDLPPAIEQGVDMIYIDEELVPRAVHDNGPMGDMRFAAWTGAPVDLFTSVNPIYTDLRRGLVKYRQRWGDLPSSRSRPGRP